MIIVILQIKQIQNPHNLELFKTFNECDKDKNTNPIIFIRTKILLKSFILTINAISHNIKAIPKPYPNSRNDIQSIKLAKPV